MISVNFMIQNFKFSVQTNGRIRIKINPSPIRSTVKYKQFSNKEDIKKKYLCIVKPCRYLWKGLVRIGDAVSKARGANHIDNAYIIYKWGKFELETCFIFQDCTARLLHIISPWRSLPAGFWTFSKAESKLSVNEAELLVIRVCYLIFLLEYFMS